MLSSLTVPPPAGSRRGVRRVKTGCVTCRYSTAAYGEPPVDTDRAAGYGA